MDTMTGREPPFAVRFKDAGCKPSAQGSFVLRNVSLDIKAGEWISLIGSNGCGKSTLARLLVGLLPLSSGSITVEGYEMTAHTITLIRERVGIVFANPDNQFVGLSVAEDIVYGMENRQWTRERMREQLHWIAGKMEIAPLLERHPATLSGGQKQRVAIAAVLAMEPSIVIFDEATAMLDERSKREMLVFMRELKASGRYTLIAITHETDEMLASDVIVALEDGAIAGVGKPDTMLRDDAILQACRIAPPYYLQLSRELRARGCDIGDHLTEESLMEAILCRFNSRRLPIDMLPVI